MTVTFGPDDDEEDDGSGLEYNSDGSITVKEPTPKKKNGKEKFNANLAESLDESELDTIASELLEAIEDDLRSRKDWEETFSRGIDLLGLKIEEATSAVTSGGSNISKAKDPLLLEAVLRYQSNFNAEMLPADGPVKIRDDKVQVPPAAQPPGSVPPTGSAQPGTPGVGLNGGASPEGPPPAAVNGGGPPMNGAMGGGMPPIGGLASAPMEPPVSRSELAEAFEKDFNHYLTVVDKPYYPDTDRMSFSQALGGCAFKKVYVDPLEDRPISRFVMANHLIVNNGASSLHDAKRITHWIPKMSSLVMKQMMLAGVYLDIDLGQPVSNPGTVDTKIAELQGTQPRVDRPDDVDYEVFECYCYRNLKGYEEKKDLPLPYRITMEKTSRKVLEIKRNWKQSDKDKKARRRFVKFSLFPGLGFYDYGYVHILGNTTRILNGIESLMVDQGMFANFPGGMIDKMASKQETNQIRPGPGGFKPIDTGGRPISQVVMPMPYKDVSANLMALAKGIQDGGRKLGSIAELPLGEGRADVPVGTVIALIEQSTKLLSAVHKRNHAAQQEEFELLKELFEEDPQALSRLARNPARQWETAEEFSDIDLVPASDPNVASHIMRVARATATLQILQQAPPGLLNPKEILTRAFRVMGEEDIESLFLPPQPPPPQPHMIDAQLKAQQMQQKTQSDAQAQQTKLQIQAMELQDHAADRASQEKIETSRLQIQAMKDAQEFQNGVTPPNSMLSSGSGGMS